ncbi:MAG: DUF2628 domain-containing protein [Pararhizobium sp.]
MASYVILTPTESARGDGDAVFVRDGFAWLAFLLPVPWLAFHRLWIATALAVAVGLTLLLVVERTGWGGTAIAIGVLIALWIGFEGNGLRVAGLAARGWTVRDVVEAPDRTTAELFYFDASAELGSEKKVEPASPSRPRAPAPRHSAPPPQGGPALGFIDYDGGR